MSTAKKTPAKTSNPGTRKSSTKSARSRAREFALQGLYQHFVGGSDVAVIDAFTRELQGFAKADSVHYDALLHGCIELAADLDALIDQTAHVLPLDELALKRLKKRRLALRDQISRLEMSLSPNEPA